MAKEKHIVPTEDDIVNQSNEVSRASYMMPVVSRRLVFLAMAQVRDSDSSRRFVMPVASVLKALGMSDDRGPELRAICKKLMGEVVDVETPRGWKQYHWIEEAEYERASSPGEQDTLALTLTTRILPFARTIQKSFHQFRIADIAKIQGKYSYRIFEIVSSFMGLAGKGGNKPGQWFYEISVAELRRVFKLLPTEYKATKELRRNVVDKPVEEINRLDLGLKIAMDYKYQGRNLVGFKFNCSLVDRSEPKLVNPKPATQTESEDEALIREHQALFNDYLEKAAKQERLPETGPGNFFDEALKALKADPRVAKPTKEPPKVPAKKVQKKKAEGPELF